MDRGCVGRAPYHAIERVHFADKMPLAQAADGRVAAHRADLAEIETDERRRRTHARRGTSRLDAGVSAADYNDIEIPHGCADTAMRHAGKELRVFHVEQSERLLTNTEASEERVEHILGGMTS